MARPLERVAWESCVLTDLVIRAPLAPVADLQAELAQGLLAHRVGAPLSCVDVGRGSQAGVWSGGSASPINRPHTTISGLVLR